jgi:hypothetical protein
MRRTTALLCRARRSGDDGYANDGTQLAGVGFHLLTRRVVAPLGRACRSGTGPQRPASRR